MTGLNDYDWLPLNEPEIRSPRPYPLEWPVRHIAVDFKFRV